MGFLRRHFNWGAALLMHSSSEGFYTPYGLLKYTLWISRNILSEQRIVVMMTVMVVMLALTKCLRFLGVLQKISQQSYKRSIVVTIS